MALLQTLTDDFDGTTLNATRWPTAAPGAYTVAGGVLSITVAAGATNYPVVQSGTYDATNSYVLAKVVTATPSGTGQSQQTFLSFWLDGTNGVMIYRSGNSLIGERMTGGVSTTTTITTAYSATTHAWWRLRHSSAGNTIFYGTSPDGTTWTEHTVAHTLTWSVAVVSVSLMVGKWTAADPAGTGTFDKVNLAPFTAAVGTVGDLALPALTASPTAAANVTVTPTGIAVPAAWAAPSYSWAGAGTPTGIAAAAALTGPTAAVVTPLTTDAGPAVTVTAGDAPTLSFTAAAAPGALAAPVALTAPTAAAIAAAAVDGGPALTAAWGAPALDWSGTAEPAAATTAVTLDEPAGSTTTGITVSDGPAIELAVDAPAATYSGAAEPDPAVADTVTDTPVAEVVVDAAPDAASVDLPVDAPDAVFTGDALTPDGVSLLVDTAAATLDWAGAVDMGDGAPVEVNLDDPATQLGWAATLVDVEIGELLTALDSPALVWTAAAAPESITAAIEATVPLLYDPQVVLPGPHYVTSRTVATAVRSGATATATRTAGG